MDGDDQRYPSRNLQKRSLKENISKGNESLDLYMEAIEGQLSMWKFIQGMQGQPRGDPTL